MPMADSDLYGNKRRRSVGGPLIAMVVAFVLGVALTAMAVRRWDQLAAWLHPVAAAERPMPLLAATPARAPAGASPPAAATIDEALTDRVDSIEARIDAVDQRAAAARSDADRAEALLVAFAARRALDRGQPLGYLEGLLRERFGATDAPSVALVIASAQRPVTLPQLQDAFDALKPVLTTAAATESWWSGVKREMSNLFVVRRASTASNVPSDRLARAEHALDQGQVDTAAAELARLPGSANAAGWLAAARRYILARGALDRIETAALLRPPAPSPLAAPTVNGASTD